MTDVADAPPRAAANEDLRLSAEGSHIWYELMTPDPDGAKSFYEAVVPGWAIAEPAPEFEGYRMIGRADGGFAGGVNPHDHFPGPRWMGYIGVDDVDVAVTSVEKGGGRLLKEAWDIPNVGRVAMVADPQDVPVYIMKPTPPANDPNAQSDVFSPSAEQRVNWNELSTSDPVAARQFYGELFGWGSDEFMDMGEYGECRFLDHNGQRIGAICGVMPGGTLLWRYYIRVPSVTASAEAVKSNGGTVAMGPQEVPGGDHIILGIDPQGAEFALVGKL